MMMTRCQDHISTENIWFVWSKTSYSGDKGSPDIKKKTVKKGDNVTLGGGGHPQFLFFSPFLPGP